MTKNDHAEYSAFNPPAVSKLCKQVSEQCSLYVGTYMW